MPHIRQSRKWAGHRTEDKWTTLGDVEDRVFSTAVEVLVLRC